MRGEEGRETPGRGKEGRGGGKSVNETGEGGRRGREEEEEQGRGGLEKSKAKLMGEGKNLHVRTHRVENCKRHERETQGRGRG